MVPASPATTRPAVRAAVQLAGRGDLPFEQLHGEPLLAHVLRVAARVTAGPVAVLMDDADPRVADVRRAGRRAAVPVDELPASSWWSSGSDATALVLDVLCPLVPAAFVASLAERAATEPGVALVAIRPVTDTVKSVVDGRILGTIDRERLAIVTSPVVVPAAALDGGPVPDEPTDLIAWLRDRVPVELVRAPSAARRVGDIASVRLLECVDEIARRTRS